MKKFILQKEFRKDEHKDGLFFFSTFNEAMREAVREAKEALKENEELLGDFEEELSSSVFEDRGMVIDFDRGLDIYVGIDEEKEEIDVWIEDVNEQTRLRLFIMQEGEDRAI